MTAVAKLPAAIRALAEVIRKHGTCPPAALDHVADELEAALSPAELGGVELQRWSVIADGTGGVEEFKNVSGRWVKYSDVSFTPRAAEAVVDDAIRDLAELEPADADHPDTLCVKHSDLLRILVRHFAALTPPSAKGENK